jgi:hypothetical protein
VFWLVFGWANEKGYFRHGVSPLKNEMIGISFSELAKPHIPHNFLLDSGMRKPAHFGNINQPKWLASNSSFHIRLKNVLHSCVWPQIYYALGSIT